jgi:hypothetical protein
MGRGFFNCIVTAEPQVSSRAAAKAVAAEVTKRRELLEQIRLVTSAATAFLNLLSRRMDQLSS